MLFGDFIDNFKEHTGLESVVWSIFLLFILFPSYVLSAKSARSACEQIVFESAPNPPLRDSEMRWICGDPQNSAYSDVPLFQASIHLKAFLEDRAYLNPVLKIEHGVLNVEPGEKTYVKSFSLTSSDPFLLKRLETFKGRALSPSLLNEIQESLARVLHERGYPCATVKAISFGERIDLQVQNGMFSDFSSLSPKKIKGLYPESLLRFRPFKAKDPYDIKLLELYRKRLLRRELVQGTYFENNCRSQDKDFVIQQSFLVGPPRSFRFGLGVNTEVGPLLSASWTHNRFGPMASLFEIQTQISFFEQSLQGQARIFPWRNIPRMALLPNMNFKRRKIDTLVEISDTLSVLGESSWDSNVARTNLSLGPAFVTNWFRGEDDVEFRRESSLAFLFRSEWRTHSYEYYDFHPQSGHLLNFAIEHRDPSLGFTERTTKLEIEDHNIFGLGHCARGQCVFAMRALASATLSEASDLSELPPSLKTYLGGFSTLRGFKPDSIPGNKGLGALTGVAWGMELRGVDLYWPGWEPYLFWDAGATGARTLTVKMPLYQSLGAGLRWNSPIGMVQGYVARSVPGRYYFFAALGAEF